jgi:hypothetical protein
MIEQTEGPGSGEVTWCHIFQRSILWAYFVYCWETNQIVLVGNAQVHPWAKPPRRQKLKSRLSLFRSEAGYVLQSLPWRIVSEPIPLCLQYSYLTDSADVRCHYHHDRFPLVEPPSHVDYRRASPRGTARSAASCADVVHLRQHRESLSKKISRFVWSHRPSQG